MLRNRPFARIRRLVGRSSRDESVQQAAAAPIGNASAIFAAMRAALGRDQRGDDALQDMAIREVLSAVLDSAQSALAMPEGDRLARETARLASALGERAHTTEGLWTVLVAIWPDVRSTWPDELPKCFGALALALAGAAAASAAGRSAVRAGSPGRRAKAIGIGGDADRTAAPVAAYLLLLRAMVEHMPVPPAHLVDAIGSALVRAGVPLEGHARYRLQMAADGEIICPNFNLHNF